MTNLNDGLVGVWLIGKSVRVVVIVVPIVGISKVTGMDDKVKLVDSVGQGTNRSMVELGLDHGDLIAFLGCVSIDAVSAQVNNNGGVEWRHVSCRYDTGEEVDRRVGRSDLVCNREVNSTSQIANIGRVVYNNIAYLV